MSTFSWAVLCLRASFTLFSVAMARIMGSPVSFFDTTPMGRIVSRLTKDVAALDSQTYQLFDSVRSFIASFWVSHVPSSSSRLRSPLSVQSAWFSTSSRIWVSSSCRCSSSTRLHCRSIGKAIDGWTDYSLINVAGRTRLRSSDSRAFSAPTCSLPILRPWTVSRRFGRRGKR